MDSECKLSLFVELKALNLAQARLFMARRLGETHKLGLRVGDGEMC